MSCVNILDNDSSLAAPTFNVAHPCTTAQVPLCDSNGSLKTANANSTLTFRPDGTWTVNGSGNGVSSCGNTVASPIGTVANGLWIAGAFSAADFEIRITGQQRYEYNTATPTGALSGCPNPEDPIAYDPAFDTGWMSLSTEKSISSIATGRCDHVCVLSTRAVKDFIVQIRQVSRPQNAVNGSGSLCAIVNNSLDGCVGSGSSGGGGDPGGGGGGGGGFDPESPPVEEP